MFSVYLIHSIKNIFNICVLKIFSDHCNPKLSKFLFVVVSLNPEMFWLFQRVSERLPTLPWFRVIQVTVWGKQLGLLYGVIQVTVWGDRYGSYMG
jgi:hypothetical protein